MSTLAILLLIHQETGSFASAGVVVGAFTVASAAAAPVQGTLVDRYGGRRVLAPFAVLQAAALVAVVLLARGGASLAALVAIAVVAGALVPPVDACVRVLWRDVAPEPTVLEAAYQLDATSQEVIWTAGPLLVALAAAWAPAGAVFATAAIVLGGTLLFVSAPLVGRTTGSVGSRRPGAALASPALRVLLVVSVLLGFGVGAVEVGLPALALRAGARGVAGILLAVWSVGSMAGGFAYGLRSWQLETSGRYPILLALIAACTAPLIAVHGLAAALPLSAAAGVGYAPALSCEYVLVSKLVPRDVAGEAFMWTTASLVAGIAAGAAIAGPLVQDVGVPASFAVGCGATAAAALVALVGRRGMDVESATTEKHAVPTEA